MIEDLSAFGSVFRFKVLSPQGVLRFVSDDPTLSGGDLGDHNPTAAGVIATGEPFTVVADGTKKPDRPDVYAETYLPVTRNGTVAAILEVYSDQTQKAAAVRGEYALFGVVLMALFGLAVAIPAAAIVLLIRRLRARNTELDRERIRALAGDRAKSEFLATVSHELRTPMNGIIGVVQLLDDTGMSEDDRELLDILRTCSESQMTLIEEILTFGEVKSGVLRMVEEPVDIEALVKASTSFGKIIAAEKGLAYDVVFPQGMPDVRGDFKRMRQIVTNLVGNALKFTETGAVEVRATLDAASGKRRGTLRIAVEDTGPGIAPEDRTRIFDRFVQGDSSLSRKAGGTGLGLAIARSLASQMGGDVALDSTSGKGSVFTFVLPVRLADGAAADQAERKEAA